MLAGSLSHVNDRMMLDSLVAEISKKMSVTTKRNIELLQVII